MLECIYACTHLKNNDKLIFSFCDVKCVFNEFQKVCSCLAAHTSVYSSLLFATDLILHCVNDKIDSLSLSLVNDLHIKMTLGSGSEEGLIPHGGRLCVWIDSRETGTLTPSQIYSPPHTQGQAEA